MYIRNRTRKRIFATSIVSGIIIIILGAVFFVFKDKIMSDYSLIKGVAFTYKENKQLRKVYANQAILRISSSQLEFENEQLEKAKAALEELPQAYSYSVARILNKSASSLTIDLGEQDGIQKGSAILSLNRYFVGIINKTTKHTATVELINSQSFLEESGISVKVKGKSDSFGVLEYDFTSHRPAINFIPEENQSIAVNDVVETAGGDSSKYPQGLTIGKVAGIGVTSMGKTKQAVVTFPPFLIESEFFVFVVNK